MPDSSSSEVFDMDSQLESEAPVSSQPESGPEASQQEPVDEEVVSSQPGNEMVLSPSPGGSEMLLPPGLLPTEGWMGIGAVLGVLLGIGAAVLFHSLRRGHKTDIAAFPKTELIVQDTPKMLVEKLHQQGARSSQQDSFSVSPEELLPTHGLLCAVADGMGGLADGDKVSQTAVTAVMNHFYTQGRAGGSPQELLFSLLAEANMAVNQLLGPEGINSSGSTLVLGLVQDGKFCWLSVGDSRICLYRGGTLYQLNREHVYRQELYLQAVNEGGSVQAAGQQQNAGGLTSFLGMGVLKYADTPAQPIDVLPGDVFLLMSDGVYNALPGTELPDLLAEGPENIAEAIGQAVAAKGYHNQDNYTAVVIRC